MVDNLQAGSQVNSFVIWHDGNDNGLLQKIKITGDIISNWEYDANRVVQIHAEVQNDSHTHKFVNITEKPTTITGYGITDGVQEGDRVTLSGDVTGTANFDSNGNLSIITTAAGGEYYSKTASDNRYVNIAGDTMSDNLNFNTTQHGINWNMNTDGASIKFYNTSDSDTNSRLEFEVRDNGNEFFSWVNAGNEKMTLKGNPLQVIDCTITNNLSAGTITETSARKYKENISTIDNSLDILQELNGVRYQWKDTSTKDIGFIADDVLEVLPELVSFKDGEVQGMNYSKLTAVLVNAIKELNQRVQELETIIK